MKRLLILALFCLVPVTANAVSPGFGEAAFLNHIQMEQLRAQQQLIEIERGRYGGPSIRERLQMQEILDTQRELLRLEQDRQFREKLNGLGQPWQMQNLR